LVLGAAYARRMRAFVVACTIVIAWAGHAQATIRLCVDPKARAPIVDVPVNPSFIVPRDRLQTLEVEDPTSRDKRVFAYTAKNLDEYWASVTVTAAAGSMLFANEILTFSDICGNRFRVRKEAPKRHAPVPIAAATYDPGSTIVRVSWPYDRTVLQWHRLDWAFEPSELKAGRHGSRYQSSHRDADDTYVDVDPQWQIVFVRLIHFYPDGKSATWNGWLHRQPDDSIHIGYGAPPITPIAALNCKVNAPRPVAVDPVFQFPSYDEPRFQAVTSSGQVLPIHYNLTSFGSPRRISVTAPEGTTFQLHRLPRPLGCSGARWLFATDDRSRDEKPVVTGGHNLGCAVRVSLADPDTWGVLEIMTARGTSTGYARDMSVTDIGGYDDKPFRVRITPVWGSQRGAAWSGWIQVEPGCAGIKFGTP
jgi:hypothetical protein